MTSAKTRPEINIGCNSEASNLSSALTRWAPLKHKWLPSGCGFPPKFPMNQQHMNQSRQPVFLPILIWQTLSRQGHRVQKQREAGYKLRQGEPGALMICPKGGKHIYLLSQSAPSRDQTRVTFSKRAPHEFTNWGPHQHEWQCNMVPGLKMIIQDIWLLYPAQWCSQKHGFTACKEGLQKCTLILASVFDSKSPIIYLIKWKLGIS